MSKYHALFQKPENQILLAVGARRIIKGVGIGGIIWGVINTGIGILAIQDNIINWALVVLGILMFTVGILAIFKPTRKTLLLEAITALILLIWNISITVWNTMEAGVPFEPRGIIFPLIITVIFFNYYRKLLPVDEQISSIGSEHIKRVTELCKRLFKLKPKENDNLILFLNRKYRLLFENDQFIFSSRNITHSFIATHGEMRELILNPDKKKLKLEIEHPLSKLKLKLNKKYTDRLIKLLEVDSGGQSN